MAPSNSAMAALSNFALYAANSDFLLSAIYTSKPTTRSNAL